MPPEQPVQTTHLSEYYHLLINHKWLIATITLLGLTMGVLYNHWAIPVYRTNSTLIMDKDQIRSPLTGETLVFESFISQAVEANTHFRLMVSRPVLEQVVRELKLDQVDQLQTAETQPLRRLVTQIKDNFFLLVGRAQASLPQRPSIGQLTSSVRRKISVSSVKDTLLMNINVIDKDPVLAHDIANAVARAYIQFDIATRLKSSQDTTAWMSDQLYEMKKKLEDAEQEFIAYKQEQKIFSMEGRQGQISSNIDQFNSEYIKAKNRRMELDVKLGQLRRLTNAKGGVSHVRTLVDNPLIGSLNRQLLDAEVEMSRLSKIYKTKHPKIIQLQTSINKTRKKLSSELQKEVANLKAERAILRTREQSLKKTVSEFENDALSINKKEMKYSILERNVETYRQLYDTLLSKSKESNIVGNSETSNLRIVGLASLPKHPTSPRRKRNQTMGLALGLISGLGLVFMRNYWDRSIRTEEDVQKHLGLQVLSVIPIAEKAKKKVYYGKR